MEASILLQEGMQLQALQIPGKLMAWLSCKLDPSMMLMIVISDLYHQALCG